MLSWSTNAAPSRSSRSAFRFIRATFFRPARPIVPAALSFGLTAVPFLPPVSAPGGDAGGDGGSERCVSDGGDGGGDGPFFMKSGRWKFGIPNLRQARAASAVCVRAWRAATGAAGGERGTCGVPSWDNEREGGRRVSGAGEARGGRRRGRMWAAAHLSDDCLRFHRGVSAFSSGRILSSEFGSSISTFSHTSLATSWTTARMCHGM